MKHIKILGKRVFSDSKKASVKSVKALLRGKTH